MNAHQFVQNFAKLLSQFDLTYQNIKDGKIVINNVEIDLNTLSLDKDFYSIDKETVFEVLAPTNQCISLPNNYSISQESIEANKAMNNLKQVLDNFEQKVFGKE